MTSFADDLYLGVPAINLSRANNPYPPQEGIGPMGRVAFHNIIPLTKQNANIVALQHTTAGTPFVLAAGTGATVGVAPDGSGKTVIVLDVDRVVTLTSSANMSAGNITIVGFDRYASKLTTTMSGPNANTVSTTKTYASVLSVTSDTTDGTNSISVGTGDVFGLLWACLDAGYLIPKWAETVDIDAGTFVAADTTSPATASTGDVRGTYAPSSASNGTRRLVLWQHLPSASYASIVGAIGQPQV